MSFTANVFGYAALIVVIVGVALLIHLEPSWTLGLAALLVGLGIVSGFDHTHQDDSN